jgi:hypothetical protein
MSADLIAAAGVVVALMAAAGWMCLLVIGLSRTDEMRFLPQWAWVLLCIISPVGAIACLIASRAWGRYRNRRPGY